LVEDVTIGLCRFKGLAVVAPHTAWQVSLNGRREALKSLGIDYSVETTLQSFGNRAALSVKLINADTREILWPEQYPFDRANVAQQYKELSTRIILALVDRIERAELARYDSVPDPTAYHLYLNGQRSLRTLDLPHVRRARRAFKEALNERPDFVPAISGVARTCQLEWVLMARGDRELLAEAERLARRSIEIDPDDARGFRELGACNLYSGRFDESLVALGQAETRNPQFADLLLDFGDALTHACDPRSGLAKITHAIELNPICPDYYWWAAAGANYHLHQYREAIACMQRMRDQTPAYRLLAASWARLGEREQAAAYVRKVLEIHPDFTINAWLSILPVRDPQYEQDYADGLREAGFH
jgi:tetratricopeptide (TPR) repeat protein